MGDGEMFEQACRPVIFEQGDDNCTYWGKGSSVLLATSKNYYWATAAHLITNMGGTSENIRIFPSDHSRQSIPFNQALRITKRDFEDYADLFVLRVDLEALANSGDVPLVAQDIVHGMSLAEVLNAGANLLIVGYPSESRSIDYEDYKIRYKRQRIFAQYVGAGTDDYSHKLQFSDTAEFNDYDGLSGSPVFHLKEETHDGRPVILPLLAGMLLRGGGQDRWGHFISSSVLLQLIVKSETDLAQEKP